MALNRNRPHLLVLPEDDATRNLAVGFSDRVVGQMQVLPPAKGWVHVKGEIPAHAPKLVKYPHCHLVLLIDYDDDFPARFEKFQQEIPDEVKSRVYLLGALTEAETLKQATKMKLGPIGQELARECEQGKFELWKHPQLVHNEPEITRLHEAVRGFLF